MGLAVPVALISFILSTRLKINPTWLIAGGAAVAFSAHSQNISQFIF